MRLVNPIWLQVETLSWEDRLRLAKSENTNTFVNSIEDATARLQSVTDRLLKIRSLDMIKGTPTAQSTYRAPIPKAT